MLREIVPGWNRERVNEGFRVMDSLGFSPGEMEHISDPRVWIAACELHELREENARLRAGGPQPGKQQSTNAKAIKQRLAKGKQENSRIAKLRTRQQKAADLERTHGRRMPGSPTSQEAGRDLIEDMLIAADEVSHVL